MTSAMTVLLIGSGGREHALAWKILQSPLCARLILAPGNDAMAWDSSNSSHASKKTSKISSKITERWDLPSDASLYPALADRAQKAGVQLVIVGPDNPLAAGIADVMRAKDLPCFGPSQRAAEIESSKSFSKEVMKAAGVPTPEYRVFTDASEAERFLKSAPWGTPEKPEGWVVKADGLALGKGVIVCSSLKESLQAVKILHALSGKIVVEKKVSGAELSWMAICDGERAALLDPARDYKRLRDGDQGPNTGGMGAYSPVMEMMGLEKRVRDEVFLPTLRELKKRGRPFNGVLYAGLMIELGSTPQEAQISVLEFNARFGDPEAQVLMPRIEGDLVEWFYAAATGKLSQKPERVPFLKESAVYVVASAAGYPENPEKGAEILGLQDLLDVSCTEVPRVFVAGAKAAWQVTGGRVLGALGLGSSLEQARVSAYQTLSQIRFSGMHFRKDIAHE